jgi:hypothetical protein
MRGKIIVVLYMEGIKAINKAAVKNREMEVLRKEIRRLQRELSDQYADHKEPYENTLRKSEKLDIMITEYQRRLMQDRKDIVCETTNTIK